jgi:hypothetical protein
MTMLELHSAYSASKFVHASKPRASLYLTRCTVINITIIIFITTIIIVIISSSPSSSSPHHHHHHRHNHHLHHHSSYHNHHHHHHHIHHHHNHHDHHHHHHHHHHHLVRERERFDNTYVHRVFVHVAATTNPTTLFNIRLYNCSCNSLCIKVGRYIYIYI